MADLLRFRIEAEVKPVSRLSPADHAVLMHIDEAPGQQIGQQSLANAMYWSKSRLSHHLTRMQARGLVLRGSADDGSGVRIFLTEAGTQMVRTAEGPHAKAVRQHLFQVATEEELTALIRLADRLATQVDGRVPY
jgi:DNA-binding MarR family transcriptional regulator